MEDKLRWKFNVFLLQIAKELTEGDLQQMKFVLRGYVASAKCEDMKALQYVEELQKLLLLTPTKLEIFKETLTVIGRPDLVEKIEEKEATFATLPGENLEQKEYDAVCDSIEKAAAAGKFKSLPRADLSASKYQPKKISLSKSQLYSDGSLQEGSKVAPDHKLAGLATGGETGQVDMANGGDLPDALSPGAGLSSLNYLEINKPASSESCESTVMDGTCSEKSPLRPNMTGFDTGVASSTTSTSREPGDDDDDDDDDCVTDGDPNKEGESKEATAGHEGLNTSTSGSGATVPSSAKEPTEATYTSSSSPKGEIVLDDEGLAGETSMKDPWESEPSEASSAKEPSEDDYTSSDPPKGTISPDDDSPAGDAPMEQPEESETLPKSTQHKAGHDPYGGARPKEKTGCHGVSLGNTKQNEKESSKVPIEDECTSPTAPHPSDPMKDTEGTEPSQKKAKSSEFVPGPGASSKSQHGPGVFQGYSSGGACGYTHPSGWDTPYQGLPPGPYVLSGAAMPSGPPPTSSGSAGPTPGAPYGSNPPGPPPMSSGSAGAMHSGPPPMSSGSAGATQGALYHRAGYSVAISNGFLYHNGDDKGVVMMKSGTQFLIAIANGNSHAAEVDITFGGFFLGVWLAEANSQLSSNPLIIEGSSWAPGRLTYFSKGDANKPKVNEALYGENPELNGEIVLEFKPEMLMLKLVVKHLWKEGTQKEIYVPDFKTATIGELKERIKQKCKDVSCLVMGGKILNEEETMSSHAIENANEVIEFLCTKEELMIESSGSDPITMTVDPLEISVEDVKKFIGQKWNIPVPEQYLRFNGQNVEEIDLRYDMFVKSKGAPKIKVDKDRDIPIKVSLNPDEDPKEVTINWFATVDELKEKLRQQYDLETITTLLLDGIDILTEDRRKKLIDFNLKPTKRPVFTVRSLTTPKSTFRGFSTNDFGSRTRGFGSGRTRGFGSEPSSSFKSRYRGIDDPPGSSTFRAGTDGIQHDSAAAHTREGIAMLHGNQESVYKNFQLDEKEWKFSKEKAVTLTIQLIDQSAGGVSGPSPSYMPTGIHDPGDPRNPMSTLVPPPVPE